MAKKTRKAVSRSDKKPSTKASKGASIHKNPLGLSPTSDRLFLKPLEEKSESQTASGIYLPDTAKAAGVKKGTVVAAGPGKWSDGTFHPISVSIGDTVLYQWGEKVTVKGTEYVVVRDSEIVAVVK